MQRGSKSHMDKQSHLKSQFPHEMTLLMSQRNFHIVPHKIKFPVHFHLKYMLQKVSRMTEVKLRIGRLLLIGIYWYQSTNRRFIHSHLFIHSHKSGLTIGLMVKPPLMRIYKKIKQLNLKLHLTKITSKIYAKSSNSN